jgi:hypothetical protein
MNLKEQADGALARLVGMPVARWNRLADMAAIGFGPMLPAERRGENFLVPQFDLHIQETWRVSDSDGEVLFGYADWHYPPRGSAVAYGDFDEREARRTHQDDLRDDWLIHGPDAHSVVGAAATMAGDITIEFSDRCRLETFVNQSSVAPEDTLDDEHWRLIEQLTSSPSQTAHFIVTARGVIPDAPTT